MNPADEDTVNEDEVYEEMGKTEPEPEVETAAWRRAQPYSDTSNRVAPPLEPSRQILRSRKSAEEERLPT